MKIALTSDLHLEYSEENRLAFKLVAGQILGAAPDVLVIAGDIGNSLDVLGEGLRAFQGLRCIKLFVAGNHDLWVESPDEIRNNLDSGHKFRNLIPAVCRKYGFLDLSQRPFVRKDLAFVGSPGWYDFSLRNPLLEGQPQYDYGRGTSPSYTWEEYRFLKWPAYRSGGDSGPREELTPPEICRMMHDELEGHIKSVQPYADRIIAVIHTLPSKNVLGGWEDANKRFYDAYMGSAGLGALLKKYPKIEVCLGGHQHHSLEKKDGTYRYYRAVLGHVNTGDSLTAAAAAAVKIIEI
jgi:hypothetical protein